MSVFILWNLNKRAFGCKTKITELTPIATDGSFEFKFGHYRRIQCVQSEIKNDSALIR